MLRARAVVLVLCGTSLSLAACWTSASTGDELTRRVTALESGASQQRAELQREVQTAQTKVGELEKVLEQATRVVTRASADTGAQVETLQQQVQALEGQLAELRNEVSRQQTQMGEQQAEMDRQLKKIASRVGIEPTLDPAQIPAEADAHWTAAQQSYDGRDWGRARALYRAFVERHRADERADDAQYRIGMTFMEEQRPATALGELRRVIADFPRGDAADDALLAMGDAFYQLHACTDARSALDALIRTQASSPLVPAAREKLRVIQRAPRGYCTS